MRIFAHAWGDAYRRAVDKQRLIEQIRLQLRRSADVAQTEGAAAAAEARFGASASEKKQDARVAMEYSNLARGHTRRAKEARGDLAALDGFNPPTLNQRSRIDLGAIVEVEDEDTGEGRTLFLAPVGAGFTLLGPGGDGHLSVVTPASPLGKAIIGRREGDVVDCTVRGEPREWLISFVG